MTKSSEVKMYSMNEIKQHNNKDSLWFVIDDGVYDVTKFMSEHPGGDDVLLEHGGENATEAFNDVGHSSDAKELMKDYKIGELCESERKDANKSGCGNCLWAMRVLLPIGIAVTAVFIAYKFYSHYK